MAEAQRTGDDGATYHVRIHDLPQSERPRERLLSVGAKGLSNTELLAILLRTGTQGESALGVAGRLLATYGLDGLQRASAGELAAERGLGPATASQLKAALELGQRLATLQPEERPSISGPEDVRGAWWARRWPSWSRRSCGSCCSVRKTGCRRLKRSTAAV